MTESSYREHNQPIRAQLSKHLLQVVRLLIHPIVISLFTIRTAAIGAPLIIGFHMNAPIEILGRAITIVSLNF